MGKTVRWGVLGAANFARHFMAPAIHEAEGAELVALATSSEEKAAGFRAFSPGLTVYPTYEALLAAPDIDAVYLPLPNHLHVEWTKKAIAAGKHVLTEKPIAMSAGEIDELIALRDASGLLVSEAYMIVHHPQMQRARQLVAEGAIGTVRHVDAAFTYDNRAAVDNIRNRPETGGGSLPDIGVYTLGSARWVTGAEPDLDTIEARLRWENGVDVFAQVTGRFGSVESGFTYSSITSMRLFPRQEIIFQGDKGLIRLSAPWNANVFGEARVELHREGLSVTIERFPAARQYKLQVEAFGRAIREGAEWPWPLEQAQGTQRLLDRIVAVAKPI